VCVCARVWVCANVHVYAGVCECVCVVELTALCDSPYGVFGVERVVCVCVLLCVCVCTCICMCVCVSACVVVELKALCDSL